MQTRETQEFDRPQPDPQRRQYHQRMGAFDPEEPRLERRLRTLALLLGAEIVDVEETVVDALNGWDGSLSEPVLELWRGLVCDPCPFLRLHAALALGDMLMRSDPLSATWLVSTWSMADEEPVRLAVARALHCPVHVVGAEWALEHLAKDGSVVIRETALAALRVRHGSALQPPARMAAAH